METLGRGLSLALRNGHQSSAPLEVLDRQRVPESSTFPCERVTWRRGGQTTTVFCKYEAGVEHNVFGHRRGVGYEARVYEHVLDPIGLATPKFYGSHVDDHGDTWLIIEDLADADSATPAVPKMQLASSWIGEFHRRSTPWLETAASDFLHRHDADYYLGWARRTSEFAGDLHDVFPWLQSLCDRFGEAVSVLHEAEQVITHGEFYANNALLRRGQIRTVDWESAAVGAGEIDLAAVVEGRPPETIARYAADYAAARWPEGAPPGFHRALLCARLHQQFRWLGDRVEWTQADSVRYRFDALRDLGTQLGLI